jgi:hypothetical protein
MTPQDICNHRVRRAIQLTGFDAQFAAMRVIVRNTKTPLLLNCPWYVEWMVANKSKIEELAQELFRLRSRLRENAVTGRRIYTYTLGERVVASCTRPLSGMFNVWGKPTRQYDQTLPLVAQPQQLRAIEILEKVADDSAGTHGRAGEVSGSPKCRW